MPIFAHYNQIVPQTCGVGILGMFRDYPSTTGLEVYQNINNIKHQGGCDWLIVSFTKERPEYAKAYDLLIARYGDPVYQSPKRKNRRSDRVFFFCIWDTRGK